MADRVTKGIDAARPTLLAAGFTLTEVMLALAILVFAATTMISAMFAAAGEHRGSDMRLRASNLVESVLHDAIEDHMAAHADTAQALPPLTGQDLPGYEGMRYVVAFVDHPEDQNVVQARTKISFREQGEESMVEFQALLVRQIPFSARVQAARAKPR